MKKITFTSFYHKKEIEQYNEMGIDSSILMNAILEQTFKNGINKDILETVKTRIEKQREKNYIKGINEKNKRFQERNKEIYFYYINEEKKDPFTAKNKTMDLFKLSNAQLNNIIYKSSIARKYNKIHKTDLRKLKGNNQKYDSLKIYNRYLDLVYDYYNKHNKEPKDREIVPILTKEYGVSRAQFRRIKRKYKD